MNTRKQLKFEFGALTSGFIVFLFLAVAVFAQEEASLEKAGASSTAPVSYKVGNERDPFMSLVTPEGYLINLEPESEISDIYLEGSNIIAEGEYIGKFKVEEIKKDKIILQNGQNTHIIELTKEVESEQ